MKEFNFMQNIGSAKYVVNYHDGVQKHRDGSPFFDMAIFSNKKELSKFRNKLVKDGYKGPSF